MADIKANVSMMGELNVIFISLILSKLRVNPSLVIILRDIRKKNGDVQEGRGVGF